MKKVGVIIAGCGFLDGAEIQETVATLAALENQGLEAVCFAPDIDQMHVVNHLTQSESEGEKRNVLVESARIVRGKISALKEDSCDPLDALMLPGGFGVAKNLSNYAVKGTEMEVNPIVATVIEKAYNAGKPIAALCISPVVLAKLLKDKSPVLTVGADGPDAENLKKIGGIHTATTHEEVVTDTNNKLISGPCYMLNATVGNIMIGAEAVVVKMKEFL